MAGIFGNTGSAHALTNAFTVFGHHMTGSTGTLFLSGIVVGAVGMLGLGLLVTGVLRSSRRAAGARHGQRRSHRETAAVRKHRDDPVERRDTAREQGTAAAGERDGPTEERGDLVSGQGRTGEQTAGTRVGPMPQAAAPAGDDEPAHGKGHRRPHLLGHHSGRQ